MTRPRPKPNNAAQISSTISDNCFEKRASRNCSGVPRSMASFSRPATLPSSVSMPVATTTPRAAVGHRGALEAQVDAVAQRQLVADQGFGAFLDGDRFARQRRLIDLELRRLQQPQVGRNLVARLQQHDVARHQVGGGHGLRLATPQYLRLRGGQLAQRRNRLVGPPRLREADHRVQHHDDDDDEGIDPFAQQPRHHGRRQQHQDHEVGELVQQQLRPGARLLRRQFVGAVFLQAARGFFGAQASGGIGLLGLQHLGGGAQVPVGRGREGQVGSGSFG